MTLVLSQNTVDAGVVAGRREFSVTLTNGGSSAVTLVEVDLPEMLSGLAIAGPQPPYVIPAGGAETFTLIVRRNGSKTFNGTYTFRTADASASVTLTGERLILIDLMPNWGEAVRMTWSFKTDIFTTEDGHEKRIAKRHQARRSTQAAFLVKRDRFAEFRDTLQGGLSHRILIADPTRAVELESGSTTSALNLPPGTPWAVPGAFVVMADGEFSQIVSVASNVAALNRPLTKAYATGSVVRPGHCGYSGSQTRFRAPTDDLGQIALQIEHEPGHSDPDIVGPAEEVFRGKEIFPFAPDFRRGADLDPEWPLDTMDFGHGAIQVESPLRFPTVIDRANYVLRGSDVIRFIDFFRRMRGRQGEFYKPTGLRDLKLREGFESPSPGYIRVEGDTAARFLEDDPTVRAIRVNTDFGPLYHRIEGFSVSSGDTVIQLDNVPTVAPASWGRVSWMHTCRFASDDLTVNFETDDAARITTTTQNIEDF